MGALRKAGVWLGLVEEEDDDRGYDDGYAGSANRRCAATASRATGRAGTPTSSPTTRKRPTRRRRCRGRGRPRHGDRAPRQPERGRGRADRTSARARRARAERSSVRSITRSTGAGELGAGAPTRPGTTSRWRRRCSCASGPSSPTRSQRYQITTLHPTTYSEARTIGEHFRDGVPVIMNLTEMDEADASRLVDFAAGSGVRPARYDRARHQPGVPALTGQRPGHRRGQGQDR